MTYRRWNINFRWLAFLPNITKVIWSLNVRNEWGFGWRQLFTLFPGTEELLSKFLQWDAFGFRRICPAYKFLQGFHNFIGGILPVILPNNQGRLISHRCHPNLEPISSTSFLWSLKICLPSLSLWMHAFQGARYISLIPFFCSILQCQALGRIFLYQHACRACKVVRN